MYRARCCTPVCYLKTQYAQGLTALCAPAGSTGQSAALKAMIASLKNKAAQRAAKRGKQQLGAQGKVERRGKERSL